MKLHYIFLGAALALILSGCSNKSRMNEAEFVTTVSDISLTINGERIFTYYEKNHQLAYDDGKSQFRVMDDDLNNFMVVTLGKMPSNVGDIVDASITYTTDDDILERAASFTVSRMDNDKCWLWNEEGKIGVVVTVLH